MSGTLAVVGAGAKAVAVAAKAAALRQMGIATVDVVAIERTAVAANWRAEGGWTDGRQRLGTNPEKDVGFPYRSRLVPGRDAELDAALQRWSWQAFLIATDQFVGWVDRGRPAPSHDTWAQYLRWVAEMAGLNVIRGELVSVDVDATRWNLHTRGSTVVADALMITGPGQSERSMLPGDPRVLSIAQFWRRAGGRDRISAEKVAVIGGGETAASMLNELFHHRVASVTAISPQPTLYTRGEGYFENSLFSDPDRWRGLTRAERLDCISRTDRGVFSARVQEALLADERIRHLRGRVTNLTEHDGRIWATVRNGGDEHDTGLHGFDLVIDGSGADPMWFTALLAASARERVQAAVGDAVTASALQETIGADLAVTGMSPTLFLPNLAGLSQGPGFPNLSCLGLLSDRILGAEITADRSTMETPRAYQSV
ncbi:NADPH-dependent L-lysine N(6)-monooxygenase MbtG [Mycobacterium koreense]|uniref:L-lysine N6-monooxygenase MbtG n=1 Tax=Mycolicibacillus koreensis TaxID=1069220 RepID=A0A7I7SA07_9MYCO|nr:NADPH-dependent L-lysine N(6)-monooxygenase MbtG [Mycolicibacillus koreensis]MCV7249219.1 NADPH-dependent L-lysine N(6)-monooxygenase MbtG [Mycolicibacillus koreensis]OSC33498.1 lysine 6-monooxygenase [Mycolicibacillus koreensis]BBY53129.1 L-lysine N6-monooxygenase MbtG [Mycolicibacillus koreensis]